RRFPPSNDHPILPSSEVIIRGARSRIAAGTRDCHTSAGSLTWLSASIVRYSTVDLSLLVGADDHFEGWIDTEWFATGRGHDVERRVHLRHPWTDAIGDRRQSSKVEAVDAGGHA